MFLDAIARGEWYDALRRARAAIDEAGAILEERPFAGVMVSFRVELVRARALRLIDAMTERAIELDPKSIAQLHGAAARDGPPSFPAMIAVTFPDGDPEMRHETPSVPG